MSPSEPVSGGSPPLDTGPDTTVTAPAYPTLPEPTEPTEPTEPVPEGPSESEGESPLLSPDGAGEALIEPPVFSLAKKARSASGDNEPQKRRGAVRPAELPDDPGTLCPPDAPTCQETARAYGEFIGAIDRLIASCPPSLAICRELAEDETATPEELEAEFRDLVAECMADPDFCAELAPVLAELTGVLDELAATCERGAAACQTALCQDLDLDACPREGRPRDRPRGSPRPSPSPRPPSLGTAVPASLSLPSVAPASRLASISGVATSEVAAANTATVASARTSRLPFTGFPALALALLGLGLSLAGAALLRRYS